MTLAPSGVLPAYSVGPGRLTAGLDRHPRLDLRRHLDVHGPLPHLTYEQLVELANQVRLSGRGGAAFPFARKVQAVRHSAQARGASPALVVNASEGEPASFKDRMLMRRAPHLILDGAFLAASALGARSISIGAEQDEPGADSLVHAIGERPTPFETRSACPTNRARCSSRSAVRRTRTASSRRPPACRSPRSCTSAGATIGQGVLVGGYHGTWISPDAAAQAVVSREGLSAVGGSLGAGIVLPLGDGTCPLGETARVLQYLAGESAGQCGPCRRGLPEVARRMATVLDGTGGGAAVDAIRASAGAVRGRGACAHPDGTARFALSALDAFPEAVTAHVFRGGCGLPVRGILPVPHDAGTGAKLTVDWTRCDAHGLCSHVLPELISLDGNGYPAIVDRPVPDWLISQAHKAIAMCPALALRFGQPH